MALCSTRRPSTITLTMNEDVSLISAKLFNSQGVEAPLEVRKAKGQSLEVGMVNPVTPGDYLFQLSHYVGRRPSGFRRRAVPHAWRQGPARAWSNCASPSNRTAGAPRCCVIRIVHYCGADGGVGGHAVSVCWSACPPLPAEPALSYLRDCGRLAWRAAFCFLAQAAPNWAAWAI